MDKDYVKVPESIKRQWEEARMASRLLAEGRGRIVIRNIDGKEIRYVKLFEH